MALFVREDLDGTNRLDTTDNETYAGGAEVGAWVTIPMQGRAIPTGNAAGDPNIDFFQLPDAIADHYWARVEGYEETLLDYYVAATDTVGNVQVSGIQHVYVGAAGGSYTNPTSQVVTFDPPNPDGCEEVTIHYQPDGRPLEAASAVYIHVGRNGWQDVPAPDPVMAPDGTGGWAYVYAPPPGTFAIDCAFNDGAGTWDNNSGQDWHVTVANCTNGPPPPPPPEGLRCAVPGSPALTGDPATQNTSSDNFDFAASGGYAAGISQGGFGTFGQVYVNYDASHLYLGGTGLAVGGTDKSAIIFVGVDTLATDITNTRDLNGLPQGLDLLANLDLALPADVAILVADEWGDGTFPNYNLGNGYDFGQGVFTFLPNAFAALPGAQLSQFDGTGFIPTGSTDADGNRLTDRWEAAIPWSSLGATGIDDVRRLTLAGVLASSAVSGGSRYLSGNFLGAAASSSGGLNGSNDYGYNDLLLTGLDVCIPMGDLDGDGLTDGFEVTYFGDPTMADPHGHGDGDGHTNEEEMWLGTDPTNALSGLRITAVERQAGPVTVEWTTVGGKRYRVDVSEDALALSGGFAPAATVTETGVSAGVESTESFTDAAGVTTRLYRVVLEP